MDISLIPRNINFGDTKEISFRNTSPEIPCTSYGAFGLYRYPAKFIPQVISSVLKDYSSKNMKVLDPFAGSGTTGLVSRIYGLDYELWDLNPMLKILHSIAIMEPSKSDLNKHIEQMLTYKKSFLPSWSNINYWFPEEALFLLTKAWGYYHSLNDLNAKRYLLIPLLKTTRRFSYNDPQRQKLSKSPKSFNRVQALMRTDFKNLFISFLKKDLITLDKKLGEYQNLLIKKQNVKASVIGGLDIIDAPEEIIRPKSSWDIVITSPPYLQAQEYIRSSKLDLFWLGYTEEAIRNLTRKELPYRNVKLTKLQSLVYHKYYEAIKEEKLKKMFQNYFHGILGALTKISNSVNKYMFLFVGRASIRSVPIPLEAIFTEHFVNNGWKHELTLTDTIPSRVMFRAKINPANNLKDIRISKEHLVVLKR